MKNVLRAVLCLCVSCSLPSGIHSQAPFAEESPIKTDLREAVLRYMFKDYNYGAYVKVFCIAAERPLSEKFLRRFAGNQLRVVWSSDCSIDIASGVKEKRSGTQGMLMSIESIAWIKGDEAEVRVRAYSDGLASNSDILRLICRNGQWAVEKDTLIGVS